MSPQPRREGTNKTLQGAGVSQGTAVSVAARADGSRTIRLLQADEPIIAHNHVVDGLRRHRRK
jgi:hypothetical protein